MAHILLIDDDDTLREMLRRALVMGGHSVCVASDGLQGLRKLNESVQVVVVDMLMPNMGGLETIDALKKRTPSLPIIGISGGGEISSEEYLDVAMIVGAERTLSKPFDQRSLLRAVSDLLCNAVH